MAECPYHTDNRHGEEAYHQSTNLDETNIVVMNVKMLICKSMIALFWVCSLIFCDVAD
jgi:hypothetical protein